MKKKKLIYTIHHHAFTIDYIHDRYSGHSQVTIPHRFLHYAIIHGLIFPRDSVIYNLARATYAYMRLPLGEFQNQIYPPVLCHTALDSQIHACILTIFLVAFLYQAIGSDGPMLLERPFDNGFFSFFLRIGFPTGTK
jgi:hypothetical protein